MRQGRARHLATPRTLVFLRRDARVLLIEGGPTKWFAGLLNGVGGSVEPDEDVMSAALRECEEETGLRPARLDLGAVVHVSAEPVVMLFVFVGDAPPGDARAGDEGKLVWLREDEIAGAASRIVPDLVELLPRLLARRPGDRPLFLASRP
jgi:8-oxo-dGTP pyrophosphatase MutT (NUDIX family)